MTTGTLTTAGWLGLAVVGALLGVAGYGLVRLDRRELAHRATRRAALEVVPPELRFQAEPLWFRAAGLAAIVGAATAGQIAAGHSGMLVAGLAVLAPLYAVTLRHRKHHQIEVVAAVRRRATDMSPEELRQLVRGLEISHGRAEMRALRGLMERS